MDTKGCLTRENSTKDKSQARNGWRALLSFTMYNPFPYIIRLNPFLVFRHLRHDQLDRGGDIWLIQLLGQSHKQINQPQEMALQGCGIPRMGLRHFPVFFCQANAVFVLKGPVRGISKGLG